MAFFSFFTLGTFRSHEIMTPHPLCAKKLEFHSTGISRPPQR